MTKEDLAGRRGRLRALDVASLIAVGTVVVLVSLPRLRDLAVHENELDAIRFARHLGVLAAERPELGASVGDLVEHDPDRRRSLRDADFLQEGDLLRRRGYLFDVVPTGEKAVVRAWPWEHGATGLGAFIVLPDGVLFGHPNGASDWSGPDRPPPVADPTGAASWRPMGTGSRAASRAGTGADAARSGREE